MATRVSRPYMLNAIYEITAGGPKPQLSIHEREQIQGDLIRTAEGAMRYFMHLAVHGSNEEALPAIDLISLIVTAPKRLLITTMNYEPDLRVLFDALSVHHPQRYEHLARDVRTRLG